MSITRVLSRLIKPHEAVVLAIGVVSLVALSHPVVSEVMPSVEVKFTDSSTHGLAIVPASCPSDPHYAGECSYAQASYSTGYSQGAYYTQSSYTGNTCTPSVTCRGNYVRTLTATCSVTATPCPDGWSCSAGACIEPPSPSFQSFAGTYNGQSFTSTGHLEAHPTLVRQGSTTQLYWSVTNVQSCTVKDDAGNTWTGANSPTGGQTSGALSGKTTYTLSCVPLRGSTAADISEVVQVNVVPTFQEQ